MITGWNFINFDWKYLVNRASKLAIDPAISSPVGELWGKENLPLHVGMMDYLELYRKWDRSDFIKENFTLDSTAEAVVGLKKSSIAVPSKICTKKNIQNTSITTW